VNHFYSNGTVIPFTVFYVYTVKSKTITVILVAFTVTVMLGLL